MVEGLIDSHCHLFLMDGEPPRLAEQARESGVSALVCAGIDPPSSRTSRELADSLPGVFATAGVHPHGASNFDAAAGAVVEELLADPRVVAVGETGLDYYRLQSPGEDQRRAFRAHCALARETGKALVVHTREAWADVLAILADERAERVILHCFSGGNREAAEAAKRGYFCSFAGNLTYPSSEELRRAAAIVPTELLMVETDSPFLAPQAVRGSPNGPWHLARVVEALGEARGQPPDDLVTATAENARRAFGLPE